MPTLIGVDEAGYGPNLGPLVVAATRWEVSETQLGESELQAALEPVVNPGPVKNDPARIAIADSKQLYSPGGGLSELERGVLASLRLIGKQPTAWRELWPHVAPEAGTTLDDAPWRCDYDEPLPLDATVEQVEQAAAAFEAVLQQSGVRLVDVRAAVVFPAQFNQLIELHGNKATPLSQTSLQLANALLADVEGPVIVHCDKHGGRKRYSPLLQEIFPDYLVTTVKESPEESIYVTGAKRERRFRFVAKGDHFLPAALASMFAKYLRELAMRAFNKFWILHAPGTKPTAGYPADAKRFKKDIAEAQKRLQVDDWDLWRNR